MTDQPHINAALAIEGLRYWHLWMLDAGHKRLNAEDAAVYGRDEGWCDSGGYDCAICDVIERQRAEIPGV